MAESNKFKITIDSIAGGQSIYEFMPSKGQFSSAYAVDIKPDGTFGPSPRWRFSGATLNGDPLWMKAEPKSGNGTVYVYDNVGSVYSLTQSVITGVGDLNDGGTAEGNGMEYYDNYMYFARSTTIARYGPLNGTPSFTDDYWVTTLSKTALTNTTYPNYGTAASVGVPNHFLKRGKNGKLYIADVVGNQGTIHYIATTKTTVEGDTNNGSTYDALDLPYGHYPIAMENWNEYLVILCYAGAGTSLKLVFWDPTNTVTYDRIVDFEFPDMIGCGLKNINGELFVVSATDTNADSFTRITKYLGGYSFQQVALYSGDTPLPGAIDGALNRLFVGGHRTGTDISGSPTGGAVFALGTERGGMSDALFTVGGVTCTTTTNNIVTAVNAETAYLLYGWTTGSVGTGNQGIDGSNSAPDGADSIIPACEIVSAPIMLGVPFRVDKITFGINQAVTLPYKVGVWTDNGSSTRNQFSTTKQSTDSDRIFYKLDNATGKKYFKLFFQWPQAQSNSSHGKVHFPITIEGEIFPE